VQKRAFLVLAVEIVFVVIVVLSVLLAAHTHEKRSMIVGILCVIFGSMMYISPLTIMVRAHRSNSAFPFAVRPTGVFGSAACLILLLHCVDNICYCGGKFE
jgi:lipid-A-disaccharide synthase-like uncharacterized protein